MIEEPACSCGAREGEFHERGCEREVCPFCGGHLENCSCRYTLLGIEYDTSKRFDGLSYRTYHEGLSKDEKELWWMLIERKGRVPFVSRPNLCARCGALWPTVFMVPDWEWRYYVPLDMQDEMLCHDCYEHIKTVTDERSTGNPPQLIDCPVCAGGRRAVRACPHCRGSRKTTAELLEEEKKHSVALARFRLKYEDDREASKNIEQYAPWYGVKS